VTLPNFLVIGAGRSGTTSLDAYLGEHPDVYLPDVKAPSFFFCEGLGRIDDPSLRLVTRNYFVADRRAYEALFDGVTTEKAVGEVSPVYLASVHVAQRIAEAIPDARLIAVIRNPVDRVHARWVARRRDGLERRDFAELVREERAGPLVRDDAFGTYLAGGFVAHVLRTYLDRFPRERIRIHLFDDLVRDARAVMADLFAFLGVDPGFVPDTGTRHNASRGTIANPLLRGVWTRTAFARAAVRPFVPQRARDAVFAAFSRNLVASPLDPGLRADLTGLYRDEIGTLQELLDRDLSAWLDAA
jgi:hypothetical protein